MSHQLASNELINVLLTVYHNRAHTGCYIIVADGLLQPLPGSTTVSVYKTHLLCKIWALSCITEGFSYRPTPQFLKQVTKVDGKLAIPVRNVLEKL